MEIDLRVGRMRIERRVEVGAMVAEAVTLGADHDDRDTPCPSCPARSRIVGHRRRDRDGTIRLQDAACPRQASP
jgi:hypothetical protein